MMSAIVLGEKRRKGSVYLATNLVNNKVYVGITTRPLKTRISEHLYDSDVAKGHHTTYFHYAMAKYGIKNFKFEILEEIEHTSIEAMREILCALERKYIIEYKSNDKRFGYNLTDGGDGISGYKMSLGQREKLSSIHKGKILSDEHRAKISAFMSSDKNPNRGRKLSEETKGKISKANKGKRSGLENPMYGKKRPDLSERNKKKAKQVCQIDLQTGALIKIWNSLREIERETGFNRACINACCVNQVKQSHGYKWSFSMDKTTKKNKIGRKKEIRG